MEWKQQKKNQSKKAAQFKAQSDVSNSKHINFCVFIYNIRTSIQKVMLYAVASWMISA